MVLVRRIRSRGANIVVEAHGEVLFAPTGDVGRWTNRFSQRVRAFSSQEAPVNKRPRWGHYGKPLKTTFTASTTYQPVRMRVYSAVGSTSPHAYYVDQGTGIYAGNAPYQAKVLPPWERGSPSLYEHTWHPPGQTANHVVMIKGQKGQFFFDKGLKRGFQSMRMRSFQVPGDGKIAAAMNSIPSGLTNFTGNTPADTAFRASLAEWRLWRDEHFNAGRIMGRPGEQGLTAEAQRRRERAAEARARKAMNREFNKLKRAEASKRRSQIRRDKLKASQAKSTDKPKTRKPTLNAGQKANLAARMEATKFFNSREHAGFAPSGGIQPWGFYYFDRGGNRKKHYWSAKVSDLFIEAGVRYTAPPND